MMQVRERPILFKSEMVRAILDGRKTQTRRVMKPQPEYRENDSVPGSYGTFFRGWNLDHKLFDIGDIQKYCPYGIPGDRLYVKEIHYLYGRWVENGFSKEGRQKWKFVRLRDECKYFDNPPSVVRPNKYRLQGWYKRNSLFMSKKDSRFIFEITNVRAEQVQDISEHDCREEGIELKACPACGYTSKDESIQMDHRLCKGTGFPKDREVYKQPWNSINGPDAWEKNPWVWIMEFKMLEDKQHE